MGAPSTPAIEFLGLTRRFGRRVAVEHLDLAIHEGEIFGFLGPNGAGKSTTLRMLLGLTRPTRGRIRIFGRDLREDPTAALAPVGGVVDGPALHAHLTARENLQTFARLTSTPSPGHLDRLLEIVDLEGRENDRVRTYSYGMRVRLSLAVALLNRPRLLILDEPTDGLDPNGVQDIRTLLGELRAMGVTVLLSSHQLAEVEAVCDRAAIIIDGKLRACGPVTELTRDGSLEELFLELTAGKGPTRTRDLTPARPDPAPARGGWRRALDSELYKLRHSRTYLAALVLACALGALGTLRLAGADTPTLAARSGFATLGSSMALCAPLIMVFALLLGASSLASEISDGTLRTALSRPLGRSALVLGKIVALALLVALLFGSALLASAAVVLVQDGFHHTLTELELKNPSMQTAFGSGALWSALLVGTAGSYLACLATGALALLLSALSRKSAEAIIWSGLVLALLLLATTFTEFLPERALLFTAYAEGPWNHLVQIAEKRIGADWFWGNNLVLDYTGDLVLDRRRAIFMTLAVPALQVLSFFTLAWLVFVRRDVRA